MENTTSTGKYLWNLFRINSYWINILNFYLETSSVAPKKAESCGGNLCPTCNKCRDWFRNGNYWKKQVDASCSGTIRTDTNGHPDGGGSTRTYVSGHGMATGWDTTGTTCTRDNHGGRLGPGVYTVTRGTADTSSGHDRLCACKFD